MPFAVQRINRLRKLKGKVKSKWPNGRDDGLLPQEKVILAPLSPACNEINHLNRNMREKTNTAWSCCEGRRASWMSGTHQTSLPGEQSGLICDANLYSPRYSRALKQNPVCSRMPLVNSKSYANIWFGFTRPLRRFPLRWVSKRPETNTFQFLGKRLPALSNHFSLSPANQPGVPTRHR
jgi:hypothetical protein